MKRGRPIKHPLHNMFGVIETKVVPCSGGEMLKGRPTAFRKLSCGNEALAAKRIINRLKKLGYDPELGGGPTIDQIVKGHGACYTDWEGAIYTWTIHKFTV